MDPVAADDGTPARLRKGHIDPGTVHGHFHDVVDMVVLDRVIAGKGRPRGLVAAEHDAGVGDVVDQVAGHHRLLRLSQEDADGSEVIQTAIVDVIVGQTVAPMLAGGRRIRPAPGVAVTDGAGGDAPSTQVVDVVPFHDVGGATTQQAQADPSRMLDGSADKAAAPSMLETHRGVNPAKLPGRLRCFLLQQLQAAEHGGEAMEGHARST